MRKHLLVGLAVITGFTASAQNRIGKTNHDKNLNPNFVKELPVAGNNIPKVTAHPVIRRNPNVPQAAIPIGNAVNSLTNAFGPKEAINYNPDINTVTFTHRGDPAVAFSGNVYLIDRSTDGGATWSSNLGPGWDNASGFANGRYPQGAIYNPSGNTDPNNAYAMTTGATLAATNGASWGGYANGSWKLDGGSAALSYQDNPTFWYGAGSNAQSWVNRNGDFWEVCEAIDIVNNTLPGQVIVAKGTWTTDHYTLGYNTLTYPSSDALGGDADVAFGPDGQTGYIVIMDGLSTNPDQAYLPYVWKTLDGGNTWEDKGSVDLSAIAADFGGTLPLTSHGEIDIAVDNTGKCHIAIIVAKTDATNIWAQTAGDFGIYDIMTDGDSWSACKVANPAMYGGLYGVDNGGFTQSLRVQVASTWAGDKIFITWSETDPTLDPTNNYYPNLYVNALNVSSGLWTGPVNTTAGSFEEGTIFYHNTAPFVSGTSGTYTLHNAYQGIADATVSLTPPQFNYISAEITDAQFTNSCTPYVLTGIAQNNAPSNFATVLSPNPVTDKASLTITLAKAENVTIEITNITGQVVKSMNLGKLNSGENKVTISRQGLTAGSYFYTVKAGSNVYTNRMIVQ